MIIRFCSPSCRRRRCCLRCVCVVSGSPASECRRRHCPMIPLPPHITPRRPRRTSTFSSRCARGNAADSPKSFAKTTAPRSCERCWLVVVVLVVMTHSLISCPLNPRPPNSTACECVCACAACGRVCARVCVCECGNNISSNLWAL